MTNSEYLRASTRKHHDEIESSIDLLSLVSDPEQYVELLKAFSGYYVRIEERLLAFEFQMRDLGLNLKERLKTPLLESDLKNFSINLSTLPLAKIEPIVGCNKKGVMSNQENF